jgi:hypothetical protein
MRLPVVTALAAALACTTIGGPARAANPTVAECVAASSHAATLENEHKLRDAREAFLLCASPSCPDEVQEECTRRIVEVNAALPSVVFEIKDAAGNDVGGVKIAMDGVPLANRVEGAAILVDPGEHAFTFEAKGQPVVHKTLVVLEGVKERRETVVLGAGASGVASSPPPSSGRKAAGWGMVGAGAAVAAAGVVFVVVSQGMIPSARASLSTALAANKPQSGTPCDPSMALSDPMVQACEETVDHASDHVNNLMTLRTTGWVGVGVGGAAATTGLLLLLTAPSANDSDRTHASRDLEWLPVVGPRGGSLAVMARF